MVDIYMIPQCKYSCWSQWPRGLRRRTAAVRMLTLWVRIPPGAWMSVSCECCVLSGSGLWDELITRTEESYRLWCVVLCDLETSRMRRPWPALGCSATEKKKCKYSFQQNYFMQLLFSPCVLRGPSSFRTLIWLS